LGVSRRGRRAPSTTTSRDDSVMVQSPILRRSAAGVSLSRLIIPALRNTTEQQERSIHRINHRSNEPPDSAHVISAKGKDTEAREY
jgi:hypothetical protein